MLILPSNTAVRSPSPPAPSLSASAPAATPSPTAEPSRAPPCSLAELTSGSWDFDANEALPACYASVTKSDVDPRQACLNKSAGSARGWLRPAWRPRGGARCPLPSRSGPLACPALVNATLVVFGDSLARNLGEALACRLIDAGLGEAWVASVWGKIVVADPERQTNLLRVPSIYKLREDVEAQRALMASRSTAHGRAGALDVLVVSTGSWWWRSYFNLSWVGRMQDAAISHWHDFPGGVDGARAFFDSEVRQRLAALSSLAAAGVRVYWRTWDVAHALELFGAPARNESACWARTDELADELSARFARHSTLNAFWAPYEVHVALLRAAPDYPLVRILDVSLMSAARPDAHPASVTGAGHDCLHWCLPGVPDVWAQILLADVCASSM